jgi:hypothetical protein
MSEMVSRRSGGSAFGAPTSTANQYINSTSDILDGYYMRGPERKHKSPTRRLINHKNSIVDHK